MPINGGPMRSSKRISESHFLLALRARLAQSHVGQSGKKATDTVVHRAKLLVLVTVTMAAMPGLVRSQALASSEDPSTTTRIASSGKLDLTYVRPTERMKVNNYAFDAFGPYPIAGVASRSWNQPVDQFSTGVGSGRRGFRQEVRFRLRHCDDWNHHALRACGSL